MKFVEREFYVLRTFFHESIQCWEVVKGGKHALGDVFVVENDKTRERFRSVSSTTG